MAFRSPGCLTLPPGYFPVNVQRLFGRKDKKKHLLWIPGVFWILWPSLVAVFAPVLCSGDGGLQRDWEMHCHWVLQARSIHHSGGTERGQCKHLTSPSSLQQAVITVNSFFMSNPAQLKVNLFHVRWMVMCKIWFSFCLTLGDCLGDNYCS